MADLHNVLRDIEEVLDESLDPPEDAHEMVDTIRSFFESAGDEDTVLSLMESFT